MHLRSYGLLTQLPTCQLDYPLLSILYEKYTYLDIMKYMPYNIFSIFSPFLALSFKILLMREHKHNALYA